MLGRLVPVITQNLHTPARWPLLLGCVGWLALAVSPPFLAAAGSGYALLPHWLLSAVCHQIPERSFQLDGVAFAACHRCTGLYVGFTLGIASWPHLRTAAAWLRANPRRVVVFSAPLVVDVMVANTPLSRFATGLIASFPVALLPLLALSEWRRPKLVDSKPARAQRQPT